MPAREYNKAGQRTLTVTGLPFVPEIPQSNMERWQMSQNTTYSQHIRGRAPQRSSLMKLRLIAAAAAALALTAITIAQDNRPMSPRGTASAQVLGSWVKAERSFAVGGGKYKGGKWIDISYGRPLKRGREIFGSGADYGKATLIGAPIWRAGADVTTRLKTEVPLIVNSKTIAPGEYSLFIDLKEKNWTFVVSTWPAQEKYDPNNKQALWGLVRLHARQGCRSGTDDPRNARPLSRGIDLGVPRHDAEQRHHRRLVGQIARTRRVPGRQLGRTVKPFTCVAVLLALPLPLGWLGAVQSTAPAGSLAGTWAGDAHYAGESSRLILSLEPDDHGTLRAFVSTPAIHMWRSPGAPRAFPTSTWRSAHSTSPSTAARTR